MLPLDRSHSAAAPLGALTLEYFLYQFAVDGGQFAGTFYYTLLQFLIQTLDFSLSLFVPGGFDNVPTPRRLVTAN